LVNSCITQLELLVSDLKNDTNVIPKINLQKIINPTESENNLSAGTIEPATIRSRTRRYNLNGQHERQIPFLNCIEPIIVQWLILGCP
jgi:hypothetical protein